MAGHVHADEPLSFSIVLNPKLSEAPRTGRVILFLSSDTSVEPRMAFNWLSRQPIFAQNVERLTPDQPISLDKLSGYPTDLAELPPGKYTVQAVLHVNPDRPHSGTATGNLYSKSAVMELDPKTSGRVALELSARVKQRNRDLNSDTMKSVRLRSRCLSEFHQRDVFLRALVMLPDAYVANPDRKFPSIYCIPGFGGDEHEAAKFFVFLGQPAQPVVRISLDGMCALGHHAYADSASNGPWGRALVEELIPHLEKEFRLIPEPEARLLTGHSSGGWSSLWVQISHPGFFGGVWATAPDSVDFHDFSGINLYDPKSNFYRTADGKPRPIMRNGDAILLTLEDFARKEDVLGPGGQIASFEAVFSPRGPDGHPRKLWDRQTGQIDPETVAAWRKYDIVDRLNREWKKLAPDLSGKITVIMGEQDNFYLAGATLRLRNALKELGADARIIIEPGLDHGSIMRSAAFRSIMDEMVARLPKPPAATGDASP